jgi:hypothetical protein
MREHAKEIDHSLQHSVEALFGRPQSGLEASELVIPDLNLAGFMISSLCQYKKRIIDACVAGHLTEHKFIQIVPLTRGHSKPIRIFIDTFILPAGEQWPVSELNICAAGSRSSLAPCKRRT